MRDVFKFLAVSAITAVAVFAGLANGFLTGLVMWFGLLILGWIVERSVEQRAEARSPITPLMESPHPRARGGAAGVRWLAVRSPQASYSL